MDNCVIETNRYYATRNPQQVYPVEFVVRTFLGSYPNLQLDKTNFAGSRILDLGYGDGRNMPLLFNLGFEIYGLEISDEIKHLAMSRLKNLGVIATLKKGRNALIPFGDCFFQYVLACHSCYYIDEGTTFENSLNEIYRILDSRGIFICSLPMHDTYILDGAQQLADGYYRIMHDPYNYRNGTIFRAFKSTDEILNTFDRQFENIRIGFCDDDFFGIRQKVWTVVCTKK